MGPLRATVAWRIIVLLFSAAILHCNENLLDFNYQNPCFEKDIVPLVRRDCASCHERGEYGFRIQGKVSDYETIRAYVDVEDPHDSLILQYATGKDGGKRHPQVWSENSKEYITS